MDIPDKATEIIPTTGVGSEKPNEENRGNGTNISEKKLAANRRNAVQSTGPKTKEGKRRSRRNALKHGVLSSALLIKQGDGTEDAAEFDRLFAELRRQLAPEGALEAMVVESIAVAYWRARRALQCEAGLVRHKFVSWKQNMLREGYFPPPDPEHAVINDNLRLPLGEHLNQLLRYETANNRHLASQLSQLDRLQRARKEEKIPAPAADQV